MAEKVTFTIELKDRFSTVIRNISNTLSSLRQRALRLATVLSRPFTLLGSAIKGAFTRLTSFRGLLLGFGATRLLGVFTDFEKGFDQVRTLIDESAVNVEALKDEVLELGKSSGDSFTSITRGLFDVISAGVEAEKAMNVLGVATELAIGGGTTTKEGIRGILGILNAYSLEVEQARAVSDALFQAMRGGITTISLLSSNIGKLAPIARTAGLTIDEMLASVAALTKGGLSTEEAVVALRAALVAVIRPTAEAQEIIENLRKTTGNLDLEFSTAAIKRKGFVTFLEDLAEATDLNSEQMAALFPNIRALVGALGLGEDSVKRLKDQMDLMSDSAGQTRDAFNKVDASLGRSFERTKRSFETLVITITEQLEPALTDVLDSIAKIFDDLSDNRELIGEFIDLIISVLTQIKNIIVKAFNQRELLTLILNFVVTALKAATRLFIDTLPVLLTVVRVIGTQLATTLIQTFIGTTSLEISKAIRAGGFSGFAAELAASTLGIDVNKVEAAELKIQDLTAQVQEFKQQIEELEKLDPGTVIGVFEARPGQPPVQVGTQTIDDQISGIRKRIKALNDEIQVQLAEGRANVIKEANDAAIDSAKEAIEGIGAGLAKELPRLKKAIKGNLSDPTKKEFDILFKLLDDFSAKAEKAGKKDEERNQKRVDLLGKAEEILSKTGQRITDFAKEVDSIIAGTGELQELPLPRGLPEISTALQQDPFGNLAELARQRTLLNLQFDLLALEEPTKAIAEEMERIDLAIQKITVQELFNKGEIESAEEALKKIEEALARVGSKQTSLGRGFRGVFQQYEDFEQSVAQGFGQQLASSISQTVDALDQADTKFSEFAENFLRQIAKMIIKQAIFNAISSIASAEEGGIFGPGGNTGFAQGGIIGKFGQAALRLAHGTPFVPGPRVKSDIVPAMLMPGEAVIKRDSVDYYGRSIMRAINQGQVPREVLAQFANGPKMPTGGIRFAEGGLAPANVTTQVDRPVLVMDDQTAEQVAANPAFLARLFGAMQGDPKYRVLFARNENR